MWHRRFSSEGERRGVWAPGASILSAVGTEHVLKSETWTW